MHLHWCVAGLLLAAGETLAAVRPVQSRTTSRRHSDKIKPKILVVNLFSYEAAIWYEKMPSLLAHNISVPGLSPIYPQVHCVRSGEICQMTTGESEINAAASFSSLLLSPKFDFTSTYFLINGIAGVNPKLGTLGTVAMAKFTVQVALQYELDAREIPENMTTGYVGYGNSMPNEYPTTQYGTEVFELNEALRDIAFDCASRAKLSDAKSAKEYRAKYTSKDKVYVAGAKAPAVVKCDSATSDVYYTGNLLSEAFENTTQMWTNQTKMTYCMTAQEDSAVLASLLRADLAGLADYSRAILMRTASDFDRPPPDTSAYYHFFVAEQGGFEIAIENLYNAGIEIVHHIMNGWEKTFRKGIEPKNYIGDIFGSLGGNPNFGPGSIFKGKGAGKDASLYAALKRRRA
ncbi:purine nucleoside permease [Thelonectria olida]|uniref:Purine nucleoside permease n=1 Tax=Thelonectria olida TaxID=1576542 RepID=A0A9P8W896_9HYPO|nr:purine nucleoside permease [Thelonectria olida]